MEKFRFKKGDRVNIITNFGRCKEAATIVSCDINRVTFSNEYTAELEDGKWIICIPEDVRVVITYVHEPQHILRLSGLNDLADNFSV